MTSSYPLPNQGDLDGDPLEEGPEGAGLPESEGDALLEAEEEEEGLDESEDEAEGDVLAPPPPLSPLQAATKPLNKLSAKAKVKIFVFITPRFTNCGRNNEPLVDYDTSFIDFLHKLSCKALIFRFMLIFYLLETQGSLC